MFGLGAPVAMGPLNAAVKFPLAFRSRQNPTIELFIAIGHLFVDFFNRLLPGKIKAETVLVANDHTQQARTAFVKGLTDAMLKLAQSPELRQSMGCAGRERVREHFDWGRKVDRILEIYQQTIDPCPKP